MNLNHNNIFQVTHHVKAGKLFIIPIIIGSIIYNIPKFFELKVGASEADAHSR